MQTKTGATIEDLYRVDGKAELVNGEIVVMEPAGYKPSRAASAILYSLFEHEQRSGGGRVLPGSVAYVVDLPNRQSFCPDGAWYTGPPTGMRFPEGAPVFAVEVRNESDYGSNAERAIAEKRRDYFAAGTKCVWDVDLLGEDVVKAYFAADPERPIIFRRGEIAHAGDAVPGWSMLIEELFLDEE